MKRIALMALLTIPTVLAQEASHPVLGTINLQSLPLAVWGIVLGLVDGIFNPCALSVLFFMVAYMLGIGSRKRLLVIGVAYSLMVFLVYFVFVYLLTQFISITVYYIGYVQLMRYVLGGIVLLLGVLEVKDFFFYGKGVSLEIPKFAKPHIERLTKAATLPAALILGFLVSLVEIPCAGGFPLVYAGMLKGSSSILTVFYSLWYTLFFIIPLIALTLVFYFGFGKVEEAEKKRVGLRKYMRLVAGILLIFFGVAFILGWL